MSTPLFVRSVYTLLSSTCSIKGIVEKAKEYGYGSVCLVDRNVLAGAMSFKKACEKEGIRPCFGLEFDLSFEDRIFPVALYAKNDEGFQNLMSLSSMLCTSEKKCADLADLNRYRKENLLVLFSDDMPLTYAVDRNFEVEETLRKQREFFEDYTVALCDHDIAMNFQRDRKLKPLLKQHGISTFALSRTFYLNREDAREFEILKCIRDKRTMDLSAQITESGRYFLNEDEYLDLYDGDDLNRSDLFAIQLNVKMNYRTSLPVYRAKNQIPSKEYLTSLCKEGLRRRMKGQVPAVYSRRLDYELSVILNMHFEDYFLIVYDFILFAKKNNIMVGPGRGSAAGSLVSYCLGITDIDPLKYGLLFERFLNPERVSMPDIDTDFPDDKRDIVLDYVKNKYGEKHVAHIITYGTLKAKQALRDVGRVLSYTTSELDSIAKLVPFAPDITLQKAYDNVELFRKKVHSEQKYLTLFETAKKLEGNPRHESTHAAGIVMSEKELTQIVPLIRVENDFCSTQYTMEHLEELGLIKMDFLGLRNLGIIAEIVEDINKDMPFDLKGIPLDDRKTFSLIDNVNTLGVFQLESSGMQNLVRKFQPKSFEEIGMTIALFRPGPMENIPLFIQRKNDPSRISYPHKDLEEILKETYGIIVYQEQIMNIARKMAGFSFGKADILRKAMSKKKRNELEKLYPDFIQGCIANGYDRNDADNIYALIAKFANYGFNKSHSIAYALVAYELAYLKANYPLYFYKALLNGTIGSQSKTYEYINECLSISQKVRGVSLNDSDITYLIRGNEIVMPFTIVKDVGSVSANKIIEERNAHGRFSDFVDTVKRLTLIGVDKNVLENLIYAGAFDELGQGRHTMLMSLPITIKYANAHKGEMNLMEGLDDAPIIRQYRDDMMVLAENEKKVFGFYFSYNPISALKKKYNITAPNLNTLVNDYVSGFGIIDRVKSLKTRKGEMMAFVDLKDESGDISLAVMPNIYRQFSADLVKGEYVYFEGTVDKEKSCLVRKMRFFKEEQ